MEGKKVRIGIDGHMIGDHSGGNETYYQNILRAMHPPEGWEMYLFLRPEVDAGPFEDRFNIIRFRPVNAAVRNFVELPRLAGRLKLDLLHTQYFVPFFSPCPVVCTIHDICFEHYKDIFTKTEYIRQKALIPYAAKKSEIIFTVSEFSRRDIAGKYGIRAEKIIVTHNAAAEVFRMIDGKSLDETGLRMQFGLGDHPYILTVGNLQPRKNLPRLIEAFKRMKAGSEFGAYRLVIVGKKAWMYDDILKLADDKEIILTDYVKDSDLARLYNAAELFVYPSFFEGFGLPPLEAMACGTPVAVANATSLPEVVGDAGAYFDPLDVNSIQGAMEALLSNPSRRKELTDRGMRQVQRFSWDESACSVIEGYRKTVDCPSFAYYCQN